MAGFACTFRPPPLRNISWGTDNRFSQPAEFVGGSIQKIFPGKEIDRCFLDIPAGGNIELELGTTPLILVDPNIPTSVVGLDNYLLGQPAQWGRVNVNGNDYVVPLYQE